MILLNELGKLFKIHSAAGAGFAGHDAVRQKWHRNKIAEGYLRVLLAGVVRLFVRQNDRVFAVQFRGRWISQLCIPLMIAVRIAVVLPLLMCPQRGWPSGKPNNSAIIRNASSSNICALGPV
jgi:hypothetical protein